MKFSSLLYVDASEYGNRTNLPRDASRPLDIYLKCGELLYRSLSARGHDYVIATNRKDVLLERCSFLNLSVPLRQEVFTLDVPPKLPFRAAHFKLDMFAFFGRGDYGEKVGLVDLDAVLLNQITAPLDLFDDRTVCVYDISQLEFDAHGRDRVEKTLGYAGGLGKPRWFGGEFIFADKAVFGMLSEELSALWPTYLSNIGSLHHVGDEAIVSAALSNLTEREAIDLTDGSFIGGSGVVGTVAPRPVVTRWWSARTLSPQQSLVTAMDSSFLHLPADKLFLADQNVRTADFNNLKREIIRHARGKAFSRSLLNPILNWWRNESMHSPTIG